MVANTSTGNYLLLLNYAHIKSDCIHFACSKVLNYTYSGTKLQ